MKSTITLHKTSAKDGSEVEYARIITRGRTLLVQSLLLDKLTEQQRKQIGR